MSIDDAAGGPWELCSVESANAAAQNHSVEIYRDLDREKHIPAPPPEWAAGLARTSGIPEGSVELHTGIASLRRSRCQIASPNP